LALQYIWRAYKATKELKDYVKGVIATRKTVPQPTERDLINGMLELQKDKTVEIDSSEEFVRDQALNFLFAGHETVSVLLIWVMYFLSINPSVQDKLHQEVDAVLKDGKREMSTEVLAELKYTTQVIRETLRLRPPAPVLYRQATRDCELAGYHIPKGTTVITNFVLAQTSDKNWNNPREFNPDRFSSEDPNRHTFAYLPFSAGPRNCIGMKFAMQEATILLSTVMFNFNVELAEGSSPLPILYPTLHPEKILVKMTSRTKAN